MSDIYLYWDSLGKGYFKAYEDLEMTIPMNLAGKHLLMMGKKRFSDADTDAVLELTLDNGLVFVNESPYNRVNFTIPPISTTSLPRTKNTTLWIEIIAEPDDPVLRQTLYQSELPVRPSIKELTPVP